jgi:ubiquinone biosynthesis protein UbiJ
MATQSPFSLLEEFLQKLSTSFQPPADWAVHETQRRIVLLLNHVLMQEPEAMARLIRQKGRVMVNWRSVHLQVVVTPAGLLDLAEAQAAPDCDFGGHRRVGCRACSRRLIRGDKPAVRIEGDVQLAAEVNWLVDHVRWDLEEDLSKMIGRCARPCRGGGVSGYGSGI